jgi:hypothetical protein
MNRLQKNFKLLDFSLLTRSDSIQFSVSQLEVIAIDIENKIFIAHVSKINHWQRVFKKGSDSEQKLNISYVDT